LQTAEPGRFRYSKFHTARVNDRRVGPGNIEGRWIGSTAGHLVATLSIPEDSRSMAVAITRDGARSLDAWRHEGCEKLRSAFALVDSEIASGGAGVTISPLATIEAARFTPGFGRLRDVVAPDQLRVDQDDLGPVIACSIRLTSQVACVDAKGTLFDPFTPASQRAHIELSEDFLRSPIVHGRIAPSADRLYLAAWNAEGWELHLVRGNDRACLMYREDTSILSLEIVAEATGAVVVTSDGTRSRLTRLADCR
jgi:hypothetical protein